MRLVGSTVLVGLGLAGSAAAQEIAPQYRVFTLSDGRLLVAQVLATEASGMRISVPQGQTEIPFLLLIDMAPIDEAKYLAQDDWVVWLVAPDSVREPLAAAINAIDNVSIHGSAGARRLLDESTAAEAAGCGDNLDCLARVTSEAPWMWIVTAQEIDGQVALTGGVSTGPTATTATYGVTDLAALQAATYKILDVAPASGTPVLAGDAFRDMRSGGSVAVKKPVQRPAPSGDRLAAAAFVPVPGLPSLLKKDYAGFGMAMATVVPTTFAWVGATGKSAQSVPEHALLGLGGFYAFTVVANQAFGMRGGPAGSDLAVGLGPTHDGGAAVTVGGRLK